MLPSRKYYLDSIFDDFLDESNNFDIMKTDIYEQDGKYYIEIDIPGYKKEEVSIDSEDGYLTIIAEKNIDNDKNYIKRERYYGKTIRKFYIGDVDTDNIKAKFKDGILLLTIPKQEKLPNKKIIEIEE